MQRVPSDRQGGEIYVASSIKGALGARGTRKRTPVPMNRRRRTPMPMDERSRLRRVHGMTVRSCLARRASASAGHSSGEAGECPSDKNQHQRGGYIRSTQRGMSSRSAPDIGEPHDPHCPSDPAHLRTARNLPPRPLQHSHSRTQKRCSDTRWDRPPSKCNPQLRRSLRLPRFVAPPTCRPDPQGLWQSHQSDPPKPEIAREQ